MQDYKVCEYVMSTTPKITIEDLAVKLNGKMWTKGDLKRIYLDRGYNTKKMSTKTYVEETSEGNFNVKCFVECPSQDYNWCKSQAEQVIESVDQEIAEALVTEYFYVVNEETNQVIDDCQTAKSLVDLYVGGGLYLREGFAKNFIKREDLEGFAVKSISRVDYEALEVEPVVAAVVEEKVISRPVYTPTIANIDNPTFGEGSKINHERFGNGIVLAEDEDHIEIQFANETKKLLKRFAKLSKVD